MRRLFIATAAFMALAAAPVLAETREIRIPVTPADLESPESVSRLYQRVVDAAESVCGQELPRHRWRDAHCREDTITHAVETVNIEALIEAHRRNRRSVFASR